MLLPFFRVNKNQKGLKEQELRHARFDGWFITRAEKEAENPKVDLGLFWVSMKVSTPAKSRRMKDIEFISMLMLVILEKDLVGFPQANIDELYAKYDFDLSDLPNEESDEVELSNEAGEGESEESDAESVYPEEAVILREDIENFEERFALIKNFIKAMEKHNNAITNHARRLTTDFYSLWSVLALSDLMEKFSAEAIADCYAQFIAGVDGIYDKVRDDKTSEPANISSDPGIVRYYTHSIGAATTIEYRKIRHETLKAYLEAHAS